MNGIMGLIVVILFFVALFFIARGIFTLLAWASPVLIIAALIINYKTVVGYLKFLWDLLRRKPLMGIVGIILTAVGFPIVCGFLFGKAILDRRMSTFKAEIKRKREGELIDYEDVSETPAPQKEVLVLKTPPPKHTQFKEEESKNTYDEFFEVDGADGD